MRQAKCGILPDLFIAFFVYVRGLRALGDGDHVGQGTVAVNSMNRNGQAAALG